MAEPQHKDEKSFRGIPVSTGVCRGKILVLGRARPSQTLIETMLAAHARLPIWVDDGTNGCAPLARRAVGDSLGVDCRLRGDSRRSCIVGRRWKLGGPPRRQTLRSDRKSTRLN